MLSAAAAAVILTASPAQAIRLPPVDSDPERCERAFVGNTIGQANAVADRVLDLRGCKYPGADLSARTLSGGIMSEVDFSNTNMKETVMSKAYAESSDFSNADFTNAVVDRVDFKNSNLSGAKFINAVITGTIFDNVNLTGTVFEDALIGSEDAKRLCSNPTLKGDSRDEVGCRS